MSDPWDPNLLYPNEPRSFSNPPLAPRPDDLAAAKAFTAEWSLPREWTFVHDHPVKIVPDEGWFDRRTPEPHDGRQTVRLHVLPGDAPDDPSFHETYESIWDAVHALAARLAPSADPKMTDLYLAIGGAPAVYRFLDES
jgi:hypothetical protein